MAAASGYRIHFSGPNLSRKSQFLLENKCEAKGHRYLQHLRKRLPDICPERYFAISTK